MLFQDFPGPGIFKKKIQDFPGGVGTLFLVLTQCTENAQTKPQTLACLGYQSINFISDEWTEYTQQRQRNGTHEHKEHINT